ncbi:hypothetical protein Q604_UNBC08557G0001, partial [human gut metagenome]
PPGAHLLIYAIGSTAQCQFTQGDQIAFAEKMFNGALRLPDLMQPYRLEMGIRLENARGKDLYQFWGDIITNKLNEALAAQ